VVDPAAFGWHSHGIVSLFCEGHVTGEQVRAAVARHPEVGGAYTMAGQASALVVVRERNTAHLEDTLERLRAEPGVTGTQTQVVLSTLLERPVDAS